MIITSWQADASLEGGCDVFSRCFNIRGTYSTGYRAPGLDELYYYMNKGTTITQGNKDLKAEHSNYYSVNLNTIQTA